MDPSPPSQHRHRMWRTRLLLGVLLLILLPIVIVWPLTIAAGLATVWTTATDFLIEEFTEGD